MNRQLFFGTLAIAVVIGGVFAYVTFHIADQQSIPLVDFASTDTTPAATSSPYEESLGSTSREVVSTKPVEIEDDKLEATEEDDDDAADNGNASAVATSPTITTPSSPKETAPAPKPSGITLADVAVHDSASSCWMVIRSKVYDVTSYIGKHPGGNAILKGCGKDATNMFEGVKGHLKQATLDLLPGFYKGVLAG